MSRAQSDLLAIEGGNPVRVDPYPQWPVVDEADELAVLSALRSRRWGSRPKDGFVADFTSRFARFHDAKRAVAVSNGTVALEVALRAVGVRPFDEVIIPAYTFIATATSVMSIGAIPVFADIDPGSYLLDPRSVRSKISSATRAIVPVHIAGQPCDLDAFLAIGREYQLPIIEDAAQAVGASWRGRKVGAIGSMGTLSFQSSKNLTAGEGGAILTDDDALADRAWSLANCGRTLSGAWYQHDLAGTNHRLTEIQGALLDTQLNRFPAEFDRRERAGRYLQLLIDAIPGLVTQSVPSEVTGHARHLFVMQYDPAKWKGQPRRWFIDALRAEGIPCSPGYEIPLHRMPGVITERRMWVNLARDAGRQVYCPDDPDTELLNVTDRASTVEAVWIPQFALLADEQGINDIVVAIQKLRRSIG